MNKNRKLINALLVSTMMLTNMAPAVLAASGESSVQRLGGETRVETALEVSNVANEQSDALVVAGYRGEVDALTGTLLASAKDAPLLLVSDKDGDIAKVKAEAKRLKAKTVYLLGSTAAVSSKIESAMKDAGLNVKRIEGQDRFDTAVNVAKEVASDTGHAFLTNDGRSGVLADALAAGPASGDKKSPILLTSTLALPAQTKTALKDLNIKSVTIVGGESAVSKGVADDLAAMGISVDRVSGINRWETAEEVAKAYYPEAEKVIIANDGYTGSFADALVGGYFGAKNDMPILLTQTAKLTEPTKNFLGGKAMFAYILGNENVVSKAALEETRTILDAKVEDNGGEEEEVNLEVSSVNARNSSLVEVNFSKAVNYTDATNLDNYILTKNGTKYEGTGFKSVVKDVYVMDGGKTVVFEIVDDKDEFGFLNHGDKYGVDVKNAITAADGKEKLEAYGDVQKEFTDQQAPVIQRTRYNANDKSLDIFYNEPVSLKGEEFGIAIDGTNVKADYETRLAYVPKDKKYVSEIQYVVTVDLSDEKELTKAGQHDVVIYNMRDRVKSTAHNGNKIQLATTEYEVLDIAKDELVVTDVNGKDFNSLAVEFNRKPAKAKISVYQGSTKFYEQELDTEITGHEVKLDLPYTVESPEKGITQLYGKDSMSTDVRVVVENFEDEDAVVGERYEETITLYRDTAKPAPQKSALSLVKGDHYKLNDDGTLKEATITIPLLKANADNTGIIKFVEGKGMSNLKVLDKDGVSRTIKDANITLGGFLEVELATATGSKQKFEDLFNFTVEAEAGTFQLGSDIIDVKSPKANTPAGWVDGDATNTLENDAFTVLIDKQSDAADSNFKYIEGVESVVASGDNKNEIKVTYKDSMTASAAQVSNYMLSGKSLPRGTEISMDATSKIVTITLPKESVAKTQKSRLQITKDVKTLNNEIIVGTLTDKEIYMSGDLNIVDNVAPVLKSGQFQVNKADDKTTTVLELSLSEDLKNASISTLKDNLEVKANGTKVVDIAKVVLDTKDSDKVYVTLVDAISTAQKATVEVIETDKKVIQVTDAAMNKLAKGTITIAAKDVIVGDIAPEETPTDDEKAAAKVEQLIQSLPVEITIADKDDIEAASAELSKLTADQLKLVKQESIDKLEKAAADLKELEEPGEEMPAVNYVNHLDNSLDLTNKTIVLVVELEGIENPEDYTISYENANGEIEEFRYNDNYGQFVGTVEKAAEENARGSADRFSVSLK